MDLPKILHHDSLMNRLLAECMTTAGTFMDINARQLRIEDEQVIDANSYYDYLELNSKDALFLTDLCDYLTKLPLRIVDPIDLFPQDVVAEMAASSVGWYECPQWFDEYLRSSVRKIMDNNPHVIIMVREQAQQMHKQFLNKSSVQSNTAPIIDPTMVQATTFNTSLTSKILDLSELEHIRGIDIPMIGKKTTHTT